MSSYPALYTYDLRDRYIARVSATPVKESNKEDDK